MGFYEGLEDNIRAASEAALIKSVVCDSTQTIGNIITALEGEQDAKYLLEAFKSLTIGQIVHAALQEMQALGEAEIAEHQPEAHQVESEPPKKVRSSSGKKPPKRKNGKSKNISTIDISGPDARKAYEASILKTLKAGKHVDEESGITSQELRKVVGGESSQAREILNELIEGGRVAFYGKARGMRYYLFA